MISQQISLEVLIPHTVAVQLIDGTGSNNLPSPLEVPAPGTPAQIAQELQHWGHRCEVYDCQRLSRFLCLPADLQDSNFVHYVMCHDDPTDPHGIILHSHHQPMNDIEIMAFLCALDYPRAVIIQHEEICHKWFCIVFHHREPHVLGA